MALRRFRSDTVGSRRHLVGRTRQTGTQAGSVFAGVASLVYMPEVGSAAGRMLELDSEVETLTACSWRWRDVTAVQSARHLGHW